MRPFLVVGCGGSGGATLQYLMDQLKADLSLKDVHQLPAAWQFVHVDVPIASDGDEPGMPPVVNATARNGRYIGLTSAGAKLSTLTSAAATQLAGRKQLSQLATWATDPRSHDVPVVAGAGQKRSVGRIVTLTKAGKVLEGLNAASTAMTAAGVRGELADLASRISPGTEGQARDSAPVVLVVSSMAGGAGASMVLDVCRLLTQVPGVNPGLTGLFLYTPEIFDRVPEYLRRDMPGNALAMTGELLATQYGAAVDDDLAVLRALGQNVSDSGTGASFGRVIPIGARIGSDGALFAGGDLQDIYRGVGRGLAALMLSNHATGDWIKYDLTNSGKRDEEQEHIGWSAGADTQWGSFGFAQLSLGRDRYGEYAAQRIARAAVVRLVEGHKNVGGQGTDDEQLTRLVDERRPWFLRDLGLPESKTDTPTWFRAAVGQVPAERAQGIVSRHLEHVFSVNQPMDSGEWYRYVHSFVTHNRPGLQAAAESAAYEWVHGWWGGVVERTIAAVERTASLDGLPTARYLLETVAADADAWAQQLRDGARATPQDVTALPAALVGQVQQYGKIDSRHGVVEQLRAGYAQAVASTIAGLAAGKLAEVLTTFGPDFLGALRDACVDAGTTLQLAVSADVRGSGLAQLRTDDFAEWPAEDRGVPPRFAHAQNEVLLIDASTFDGQFDAHLVETTRTVEDPSPTPSSGLSTAVREVVLNRWKTSGTPPEGGLLQRVVDWRPAALPHEPGKDERMSSRRGQYRFAVRTDELLDRARSWVARPRLPFETFVNTSLFDYVAGPGVTDSERALRSSEIKSKFRDTLELAQPLVHVNRTLVAEVHLGAEALPIYKFSDVPFGDALGQELVHELSQRSVDIRSVDALRTALQPTSKMSRIDVFGSFAPLTPLAITSLLAPLDKAWSATLTAGAQADFYFHRRSRRMAGAVGMNDKQREACIGGWYVARNTGRLRLPGEVRALEQVQIYDDALSEWVSFPSPLIVPDALLAGEENLNNYLPAVMLSFGLAMARAGASASLAPLRPYTLLRRYWHDSALGLGDTRPGGLTAAARLRTWIQDGRAPEGAPEEYAQPRGADAESVRLGLLERFTEIRAGVGEDYLPATESGAAGGGPWSLLTRQDEVFTTPLFHEVAPDVFAAMRVLIEILSDPDLGIRKTRRLV